jgi:hypothetical protein
MARIVAFFVRVAQCQYVCQMRAYSPSAARFYDYQMKIQIEYKRGTNPIQTKDFSIE